MKISEWFTDKRVVFILCALLGLATVIDLYTAYSSPIFKIAETNPIYMEYGVYPLTLLNFLIMIFIIRGMKKTIKLLTLFAFVMSCLLLSYGHILGAQSNIQATQMFHDNPQKVLDQIHSYTPEQKQSAYNDLVFNNIFIPYIISLIGFVIIFYLYDKRKPLREKYIEDGLKLIKKGMETK